jgi:hypothetical protein
LAKLGICSHEFNTNTNTNNSPPHSKAFNNMDTNATDKVVNEDYDLDIHSNSNTETNEDTYPVLLATCYSTEGNMGWNCFGIWNPSRSSGCGKPWG